MRPTLKTLFYVFIYLTSLHIREGLTRGPLLDAEGFNESYTTDFGVCPPFGKLARLEISPDETPDMYVLRLNEIKKLLHLVDQETLYLWKPLPALGHLSPLKEENFDGDKLWSIEMKGDKEYSLSELIVFLSPFQKRENLQRLASAFYPYVQDQEARAYLETLMHPPVEHAELPHVFNQVSETYLPPLKTPKAPFLFQEHVTLQSFPPQQSFWPAQEAQVDQAPLSPTLTLHLAHENMLENIPQTVAPSSMPQQAPLPIAELSFKKAGRFIPSMGSQANIISVTPLKALPHFKALWNGMRVGVGYFLLMLSCCLFLILPPLPQGHLLRFGLLRGRQILQQFSQYHATLALHTILALLGFQRGYVGLTHYNTTLFSPRVARFFSASPALGRTSLH